MHQVLPRWVVGAFVVLSSVSCAGSGDEGGTASEVVINRVALGAVDASRTGLPDGSYWYDAKSGLWGLEGGDAQAFARAGLTLGGRLREDASRGSTGVLMNGRNLGDAELLGLETLLGTLLLPDRYALDELTNFGFEGEPPSVNLLQLAQAYSSVGPGGAPPGSEGSGSAPAGGGGSWSNSLLDSYGGENSSGEGYVCTDSGCATYGF
ncbi:MAG TPA: hypothetical protein VNN80_35785 [Polyangiaceae bacterium]|nr:hypothetical protein [Polyangiaceae bacterium]